MIQRNPGEQGTATLQHTRCHQLPRQPQHLVHNLLRRPLQTHSQSRRENSQSRSKNAKERSPQPPISATPSETAQGTWKPDHTLGCMADQLIRLSRIHIPKMSRARETENTALFASRPSRPDTRLSSSNSHSMSETVPHTTPSNPEQRAWHQSGSHSQSKLSRSPPTRPKHGVTLRYRKKKHNGEKNKLTTRVPDVTVGTREPHRRLKTETQNS